MGFSLRKALQWVRFGIKAGKVVLDKSDEMATELEREYQEHAPKEEPESQGNNRTS